MNCTSFVLLIKNGMFYTLLFMLYLIDNNSYCYLVVLKYYFHLDFGLSLESKLMFCFLTANLWPHLTETIQSGFQRSRQGNASRPYWATRGAHGPCLSIALTSTSSPQGALPGRSESGISRSDLLKLFALYNVALMNFN